jgi:hypothetical protein
VLAPAFVPPLALEDAVDLVRETCDVVEGQQGERTVRCVVQGDDGDEGGLAGEVRSAVKGGLGVGLGWVGVFSHVR